MNNIIIIPARLGSERFPNKILCAYKNKIILQHIIDLAKTTGYPVVLASEDAVLSSFAKENGIDFFKCSARCGTERAYLYYKKHPEYDTYITIPTDEPAIQEKEFHKWILKINKESISTAYCDFFCYNDLLSQKSCKIISSVHDNVLYFSRSIIPITKTGRVSKLSDYKKHVGLFSFPNSILKEYGKEIWNANTKLDTIESLEQNRFIELEISVKVIKINHIGFGIDTPEQIIELEKRTSE